MLSFSSDKDMNSLASDGDPKEGCFNQPPSGEDSEASFLEFEKACSGLISNLERLAQKPRKKRKREYNPTKVKVKARRVVRVSNKSSAVSQVQSSSLQTESSSVEMPKMEIVLPDFVSGLQSCNNWKKSYLTSRFRVNDATGEIEPVIATRCKDKDCAKDRQSFLQEKETLAKVLNEKDRKIEKLEHQLKGAVYSLAAYLIYLLVN